MKIKVKYIDNNDPYAKLYSMSKDQLINIIKDCDAVIEKK